MASALTDIRVLDLTDESGAFATRLMADLGADVVRVEAPDGGRLRGRGPFLNGEPDVERSYQHLFHNINKRSVVVDIESEAGGADLRQLATNADILVETGAPGALTKLGLGYEALSALNPGLIYVSITPFGQTGPWSLRRGADIVAAASGGLLYPSGGKEDPPMHGNADPSYKMAGLQAVTGALIALRGRGADRKGVHIDISLQEATLMVMVQQLNPNLYTREKRIPKRSGLHGPLFKCKDGRWVGVRVRPDRFKRFLDWAASSGVETALAESSLPRLQEGGADINLSEEVTETLRAVASGLTVDQMLEIAWGLDLIALPIGSFDEMGDRDHFVVTRQFNTVHNDLLHRDLSVTRSPFDGLKGGVQFKMAPPLGQDTQEVLAEAKAARARSPRPRPFNAERPLEGLRVVDFTWVLAGPFGTRLLANFGAEVIRVESLARPDSTRTGVPRGATTVDAGYLFNDASTGKKSLTLDLSRPEAKELVKQLVAKADVVTNNFRPGALNRMGLGYETLKKIKPDIILVSLPGCGSVGPWSDKGTLGGVLMAASGLNDISGFPGRPPYGIATAYPDFTSPYLLASSVLAAVHERDRTGEGQSVEVNQLSATVGLLGVEWMRFCAEGALPRNANRSTNHCPHGVYPAAGDDEWVAIAVDSEEQWRAFARVIGRDDLALDPRYDTLAKRKAYEDEIDEVVTAWTSGQDKWAAADALQGAGIAAAAVETLADLLERDPQLSHRGHYQRIEQPSEPGFELVLDGEAIHFIGTDRALQRAPMIGEHNEYVLRDLLGLSEAKFDELIVRGVIA